MMMWSSKSRSHQYIAMFSWFWAFWSLQHSDILMGSWFSASHQYIVKEQKFIMSFTTIYNCEVEKAQNQVDNNILFEINFYFKTICCCREKLKINSTTNIFVKLILSATSRFCYGVKINFEQYIILVLIWIFFSATIHCFRFEFKLLYLHNIAIYWWEIDFGLHINILLKNKS